MLFKIKSMTYMVFMRKWMASLLFIDKFAMNNL